MGGDRIMWLIYHEGRGYKLINMGVDEEGGGAELSNLHWMGKYRFMVLICAGEKLYHRIFMFPGRQNDSIDMCCHVLGENNNVFLFFLLERRQCKVINICWRADIIICNVINICWGKGRGSCYWYRLGGYCEMWSICAGGRKNHFIDMCLGRRQYYVSDMCWGRQYNVIKPSFQWWPVQEE